MKASKAKSVDPVKNLEMLIQDDSDQKKQARREQVAAKLRWAFSDVAQKGFGIPDAMTTAPKGARPTCREFEKAAERGECLAIVRRALGNELDLLLLTAKYSGVIAPVARFRPGMRRVEGVALKVAAIGQICEIRELTAGNLDANLYAYTVARWSDFPLALPEGYRHSSQWRQRALLSGKLTARLDSALDKLHAVLFNA